VNIAGLIIGALLAPLTGVVSWLRQSRTFHPRGIACRAQAEAVARDGELGELARALEGPTLVRFSSALWKKGDRIDVLGCALRFAREPLGAEADAGDQDLLFATIRRPWTMAFSPFTTDVGDFLANHYYAVSPFRAGDGARVEWRLSPERPSPAGATRAERFEAAVAASGVSLLLERAPYRSAFRAFDETPFRPLVRLHRFELFDIDQEALRFSPFRAGRGIVPVGFVHWLRSATYAASQRARPTRARRSE